MITKVGQDISYAASLLREGYLVGIPTETVYGLGGNGLDPVALANIFEVKARPTFDPLILHADRLEKVNPLVHHIPKAIQKLAKVFSPGPITYILPKSQMVPDLATAGKPTVAVRIPNHPTTLDVLSRIDFPVAAPSANPFGYVSPTTPAHVKAQLNHKIPYILDGGPSSIGLESTIVEPLEKGIQVLRLGGTSIEDLQQVITPVKVSNSTGGNPDAPGQLPTHYAPETRLRLGDPAKHVKKFKPSEIGILSFYHLYQGIPFANQYVLSPKGDLNEAAQHLFDALRKLDERNFKLVIAERFPDEGLGRAINDRLERASAKR